VPHPAGPVRRARRPRRGRRGTLLGGRLLQQPVVNGSSVEILSDDTMALFQAVRDGDVDSFLIAHPDWISRDQ
jgi:hypothetical protein